MRVCPERASASILTRPSYTFSGNRQNMETLVIIGGGFAGLNLIKHLKKDRYRIKLIDRNNYHCFPPLFYQVASSGLDASNISFPFRRELKRRRDVTYHMGHVKNIDVAAKTVTTSYETIHYDKLVIAAGTTNNYFGMEGMDKITFGMKSVSEAIRLRDEILDRLERGALCTDPERRRQLLSFVVVGGGPAGVEIAGALGEMKKYVMPREYPEINPDEVSIKLVEGNNELLKAMGDKSGEKALKYLKELQCDVRLNTSVKGYSEDKILTFDDGSSEYCETVVWTAGVKGEPMPGFKPDVVERNGRIRVDEYMRVEGLADVYAIGDIAVMTSDEYPHGHPQVAQVAIQMGRTLAHNLNKGELDRMFRYRDKGSMATVGKNRAVVVMKHAFMSGYPAWLAWMFIHLISLLDMRNRIMVLINWTWNYLTYSTSLRLLIRPVKWPARKHWGD